MSKEQNIVLKLPVMDNKLVFLDASQNWTSVNVSYTTILKKYIQHRHTTISHWDFTLLFLKYIFKPLDLH